MSALNSLRTMGVVLNPPYVGEWPHKVGQYMLNFGANRSSSLTSTSSCLSQLERTSTRTWISFLVNGSSDCWRSRSLNEVAL